MGGIVDFARAFLAEELAPFEPREIHRHHPPARLAELLGHVQWCYSRSDEAKRGWHALLEEAGLDLIDTARDRLVLRFQPPLEPPEIGAHLSTATLGVHRDSWASNLYAQVNWWGPVYPVAADRTMGLFPDFWDRPLPNDSAKFDMPTLMSRLRMQPGTVGIGELTPRPLASLTMEESVPVMIEPGEVIAFSAQHLHAGICNRSDETRISLDTRTIRRSDYLAGRGAPNIDGRAQWATPLLFRQIAGGQPFHAMIGTDPVMSFEDPGRDVPVAGSALPNR